MLTGPEARPIGPVVLERDDSDFDGTGRRGLRVRAWLGGDLDVHLLALARAAADDKETDQTYADEWIDLHLFLLMIT